MHVHRQLLMVLLLYEIKKIICKCRNAGEKLVRHRHSGFLHQDSVRSRWSRISPALPSYVVYTHVRRHVGHTWGPRTREVIHGRLRKVVVASASTVLRVRPHFKSIFNTHSHCLSQTQIPVAEFIDHGSKSNFKGAQV
jgi:hypothetical protein